MSTKEQPTHDNSVSDTYAKDVVGNDTCPTCQRSGQFLPARVAVVLKNDLIQAAPTELTADLPALPDSLMYVLRRLNSGYLYCYSSAWRFGHYNDNKIRAYQVSDFGYLTAIDKDNMSVNVKGQNYSCFQNRVSSKGRKISDAFFLDLFVFQENSKKINIAYSRHQWSIQTCNYMADNAALRNRSMPQFDVVAGGKFILPASKSLDLVENKALTKDNLKKIIPWEEKAFELIEQSPFEQAQYFAEGEFVMLKVPVKDEKTGYAKVDPETGAVIWVPNSEQEYRLHATDRVIVLQDPVGITEDLLEIVNYLSVNIRTEEEERLYQSAMNIIKLQSWVKAKIHAEEYYNLRSNYALAKSAQRIAQSEEFKNVIGHAKDLGNLNAEQYQKDYDAGVSRANQISQEEMENFHDFRIEDVQRLTQKIDEEFKAEWSRSTGFFRMSPSMADSLKEQQMVQWLNQQHQKIEQYIVSTINPILDCYLQWLKSDQLLTYMDSFFDRVTQFSAASFLEINSRIIGNADTMEKCSEYFAQLLNEADYSNRKNYFLRLLTFDSEKVQQDLLSISNTYISNSQAPTFGYAFTQLLDESTINSMDTLNQQSNKIVETIQARVQILAEQIGGTMARVFHGRTNKFPNSVKNIAMSSFETFSGKVLTRVEVSGKLSDVIERIIKQSGIRFDNAGSRQQAKNAKNAVKVNLLKGIMENFNSDVELKKIQGMRTKVYVITMVDFEKMSTISGSMSTPQINSVFSEGVIRPTTGLPTAVGELEKAAQLDPLQQQRAQLIKRSGVGAGFGVFAFSLQAIALMEAGRGISADGVVSKAGATFGGMIVSALGGVADVLDRQLKMRIGLLGMTAKLDYAQSIVHTSAKYALYGGAIILALVEFYKAYGALKKEKYHLASLYIGNAFLIVLTTHAFWRGTALWAFGLRAGYWGIILIIGTIIITYGISSAERSALREFLEQSAWGVKSLGWSKDTEEQQFKNVYDAEDEE